MITNNIHIGIIGGTGLAERLFDGLGNQQQQKQQQQFDKSRQYITVETPFGYPSCPIQTSVQEDGVKLSILARHGDGHILNPGTIPYRANIYALKKLGVTHIIASGATGSLQENIHPGDIVLVDQFIDKTENRERTFYDNAAVHIEFSEPCCPVMHSWLIHAAEKSGLNYHKKGTYICMEGPAFSTRAESHMHRKWGGDLIGMTALPEARLVREAEIAYALVALPTDYDCWKIPPHNVHQSDSTNESLLEEIIGNLNKAAEASLTLIQTALSDISILQQNPSPAHDALELAIWSDKSKIDPCEVEKLKLLWGRWM